MTREEKIEAEVRAFVCPACGGSLGEPPPRQCHACEPLRASLSLPREESAEGWTFAEWLDGWRNVGELRVFTRRPVVRAVRVRVTASPAAPEGDAP